MLENLGPEQRRFLIKLIFSSLQVLGYVVRVANWQYVCECINQMSSVDMRNALHIIWWASVKMNLKWKKCC